MSTDAPLPDPGLTCLSCAHYRPAGCAKDARRFFPLACDGRENCRLFEYEPGSDEAEDRER